MIGLSAVQKFFSGGGLRRRTFVTAAALAAAFMVSCFSGQTVRAETSGDFTYTVNYSGEAMITGYSGSATELTVPSEFAGKSVKLINNSVFKDNTELTKVELPDGLKTIGYGAFEGCTALEEISIPDSVTDMRPKIFKGCTSLKSIEIPEGVTNLASNMFEGCTALEEVTLPEGLKTVSTMAFGGCTSLTEIELPDGLETIGSIAFQKCFGLKKVKIPDTVTSLGSYAFNQCIELEEVNIPKGITEIEACTFSNCQKMKNVEIPQKVTSIGEHAFSQCFAITDIVLPEGLKTIDSEAFMNCKSLARVSMPESLESIGDEAFSFCKRLEPVYLPSGVKEIGRWVFPDYTGICGYKGTYAESFVKDNEDYCFRFIDLGKTVCEHSYAKSTASGGKTTYKCSKCGATYDLYDLQQKACESFIDRYWYSRVYRPVRANLTVSEDGFLRVEPAEEKYVVVEEYDDQYSFRRSFGVSMELPKFGGFYAGKDAYYLVFGQENPEESDDTEVIRIVKYNKDWERMGSDSLYGAFTKIPFNSCTLRMSEKDDTIYIETGHQMYKSPDGVNHQANMVFSFDEKKMNIMWLSINGAVHVSHSFNQFITTGENGVTIVDHGDANPRSIYLREIDTGKTAHILQIPDTETTHYNNTYTMLGGFEASDSSYLVAGSAVHYDDNYEDNEVYNVFVGVVPLDDVSTASVDLKWVTDYAEGADYSVGMPHLVKLDQDNYALIWDKLEKDDEGIYCYVDKLCVALMDGDGNLHGDIQEISGSLSDCKPFYADGKIVWYIARDSAPKFYSVKVVWSGDKAVEIEGGSVADSSGGTGGTGDTGAGSEDTSKTGLSLDTDGRWRYYVSGKLQSDYNGYVFFADSWWAVAGGQVYPEYTGLWGNESQGWWYAENGRINVSANGYAFFGGSWWAVAGGQVHFEYTGLWGNAGQGWWYAKNGAVDFTYTGTAEFAGRTWNVVKGQVVF